ncbi:isocitrate lyase family-domain-containing protein [Russula ochroleuca]|uniref:methylisocitrate lyase n=1 Tax=Russula ochroleuca TaxID=152965 RepID=A0A9P5MQ83_9AGAM|nr:isocitrate lyase family-domain-containing protein [Russula ochroleuca]
MLGCSYLGRTADSHFHLVLAIPRVLDTSSATTLDDDWLALEARWFVTNLQWSDTPLYFQPSSIEHRAIPDLNLVFNSPADVIRCDRHLLQPSSSLGELPSFRSRLHDATNLFDPKFSLNALRIITQLKALRQLPHRWGRASRQVRHNLLKSRGPPTHAREHGIMKAELGRAVLAVKSKERTTRPGVTVGPPAASLGVCAKSVSILSPRSHSGRGVSTPVLGDFHSNEYVSDLFAKAFAMEGMKAFVELNQRKERELGTDMLTRQKWSGTNYGDNPTKTVTGGISSTATTAQFMMTNLRHSVGVCRVGSPHGTIRDNKGSSVVKFLNNVGRCVASASLPASRKVLLLRIVSSHPGLLVAEEACGLGPSIGQQHGMILANL